jgi:hypothetical protein
MVALSVFEITGNTIPTERASAIQVIADSRQNPGSLHTANKDVGDDIEPRWILLRTFCCFLNFFKFFFSIFFQCLDLGSVTAKLM